MRKTNQQLMVDAYARYAHDVMIISDIDERLKKVVTDYCAQFADFYEIFWESNSGITVSTNKENTLCRIVFAFGFITGQKERLMFAKKEMRNFEEQIFFTKNTVIIQKELNFINFSPIQGYLDQAEIKEAVEEAEISRLKKKV